MIAGRLMSIEEDHFARGIERAKWLVRMLAVPDPRVQLAAARVIDECAERVMLVVEELARQEENQTDAPSPSALSECRSPRLRGQSNGRHRTE